MPIDIFDADINWPATLHIIAPGSSVDLDLIPPGATTLALNRAVCLPRDFTYWLIGDCTVPATDYWPHADHVAALAGTIRIFAYNVPATADYRFKQDPAGLGAPATRCLRAGATVLGQTLQMCYHFGINAIVNGADMGAKYCDGLPTHGEFPRFVNRIGGWVDVLESRNLTFECVTPGPLQQFNSAA